MGQKTPWDEARSHQKSQRQERRIADLPDGKKQVNSGRQWHSKRDVRLGGFLVEARTTDAQSYRVEKKEFETITRQAVGTPPGCLPAMFIEIDGLRLVVTREQDFEFLRVRAGL